jgi:arabinose-5-phosphate isomerase
MMSDVMTRDCVTVSAELLAAEAVRTMQDNKIMALLVVDDQQKVVGALNVHDFLRAGVM